MSTEKIKSFLQQKKTLIVSGIALFLIVSAFFTVSIITNSDTKAVALVVDGDKDVYHTEARTVQGFLDEQNIEVKPQDEVSVELHTPLEDYQTIEISSAVDMTIIDGGKTYHVKAQPGTVDEVLTATGHKRGHSDWVSPKYNSWVDAGAVITVNRIAFQQASTREVQDLKLVYKEDASMPAGTAKVLQEGVQGVDEVLYEYVFKDGEPLSRSEIDRTTLQEPLDKIVACGKKAAAHPVAGNYSKAMTVTATAYTHTGNRTATGTVARVGVIAVDPRVIPLGTKVYVEGYGYATAEDTGGAIKGNKIDIFLNSESQCRNWGRKSVKLYILD